MRRRFRPLALLAVPATLALTAGAAPTATWTPDAAFSPPDEAADGPTVALNGRGDAVAVWARQDPTHARVRAAYRPANGAWGAPIDVGLPQAASTPEPQVAIDAVGDAVAVWRQPAPAPAVWASLRPASSGVWGQAVALSTPGAAAFSDVQVAMDGRGDAVAVWVRTDPTPQGLRTVVQGAFSRVETGWGAAVDLSQPGGVETPAVAIGAASGIAVAVWTRAGRSNDSVEGVRGWAPGNAWQVPLDLSAPGADAGSPAVAVAPQGDAVATWSLDVGPSSTVEARTLPLAAGGWLPAADLPRPGTALATDPRLAADGRGGFTAVWWGFSTPGARYGVGAARLAAATAAWSPPADVSPAGRDAFSPQVALDARGDAVAIWRTPTPGTAGTDWHVAAATRATSAATWQPGVGLIDELNGDGEALGVDAGGGAVVLAARQDGKTDTVRIATLGAGGPSLGALRMPASGVRGRRVAFSVAPADVWTPRQPTRWRFGDGDGATGDHVTHVYRHRGRYRVHVTATNALGASTTATGTIVVAAAPSLTRVTQTHRRWRRAGSPARGRAAPVGTTFSVTLDVPARVRLAFSRLVRGRPIRAAAAVIAVRAGRTRIPCDGRVGARRLRPGRYAVAITATDAAGRASPPAVLRFRIVR
jgi:hypothetical protein